MSGRVEKARRAALKDLKAKGVKPESGSGAVALDVELPFSPYPHQRAAHALRATFRFLVLVWHRRAGKKVFCIVELVLAALVCQRERPRFGYIAPFRYQAKAIAWEYLKSFSAAVPGAEPNESDLTIAFPNGAVIGIFGADHPDAFRGWYFDGVVLDEYAQIKPALWGEALRPALSDRKGWAIFIGTPKGVNAFSEVFFKAQKDGGRPGCEWAADLKRWSDTKVLDPAEVASAKRDMSPNAFAQEYECDFFAAATNVVISLEAARAATERNYTESDIGYAARVLGVDVARYGDDRSVVARRQGLVCFRMDEGEHVFRGLDTMQLAAQVARIADRWRAEMTFVDGVGVGAGVVDRLRQLGYRVTDVQAAGKPTAERFANKRSEMWWAMGDWMSSGSIPQDEALVQELVAQTYTYANRSGKWEADGKDEVKERLQRSPDKADALGLTFAEKVISSRAAADGGTTDHVVTDYEPFGRAEA